MALKREIKFYKIDNITQATTPDSLYAIKSSTDTTFKLFVNDIDNNPIPLFTSSGGGTITNITSTDSSILITGSSVKDLKVSNALQTLINSALQSGDFISSLINDTGYLTIADLPVFTPSNYDLVDFTNNNADHFIRESELALVATTGDYNDLNNLPIIPSGATNITTTQTPTSVTVNSDTGTYGSISLADGVNAGVTLNNYTTAEKDKLNDIEPLAEVNNISDTDATDLTDGGNTTLHNHDSRYYTETETDNFLNNKVDKTTTVNGKQLSSNVILNTDDIQESGMPTNKWFTEARVLATVLSGLSLLVGGSIISTDSILIAFGKIQKQLNDGFTGANIRSLLGITTLSGSNTGDQTTITGNAGTATVLQTARTIGITTGDVISSGSIFNGSSDNTNALTIATGAVTSTKIADGTILNVDINASAGIDASKINTGVVSNTEFNYLDGVTSAIQPQIDGKQSDLYDWQTKNAIYYYNDFEGILPAVAQPIDGKLFRTQTGTALATTYLTPPNSTWKNIGTPLIGAINSGSSSSLASTPEMGIILGYGEYKQEALIQVATLMEGLNTTNQIMIGFGLSQATIIAPSVATTSGCLFVLETGNFTNGTQNSLNWQCVTSNVGVKTSTLTAVTYVQQWVKLTLVINALATEVKYYIDDVLVATHTTNIPTIRLGLIVGVGARLGGTINKQIYIDYVKSLYKFTNTRY